MKIINLQDGSNDPIEIDDAFLWLDLVCDENHGVVLDDNTIDDEFIEYLNGEKLEQDSNDEPSQQTEIRDPETPIQQDEITQQEEISVNIDTRETTIDHQPYVITVYQQAEQAEADSPSLKLKLFKCPFCCYAAKKSSTRNRHMAIHSTEWSHKCHICSKTYKTRASLRIHVKLHTRKMYKCYWCSMQFTSISGRVIHMRYRHSDERLHKCDMCDYTSFEKSKIKRHANSRHKKLETPAIDSTQDSE